MRSFLIGAALLIAFSTPALAQEVVGRATVIDGDTLDIRGQRIRLHGVDAPESSQRCGDADDRWSCGRDAAMALSDLIGAQTVACEVRDQDTKYNRLIAVCRVGRIDVGQWMVYEGWATAYTRYSRDYVSDEQVARQDGRNIWSGDYQNAESYRHDGQQTVASDNDSRETSSPSMSQVASCLAAELLGGRCP